MQRPQLVVEHMLGWLLLISVGDTTINDAIQSMRFTQPGLSEASVAAHFEYICALGGAQRPAYVPVVASGSVFHSHGSA